ncbi:hypothetical protein Tco_1509745 [Tanacetum coccineum]
MAETGERIDSGPGAFTVITNALFQADGVEVYYLDCDDVPNAQPSFMANISSYGFDVLTEVNNQDNMDNNMINQAVQVMSSSEESSVVNHSETEITSDSNIIPYSQYVTESQQIVVQNSNSSAQQDALILYVIEQLKSQSVEIDRLKQTISEHLKENESLMQTVTHLKNDFKKKESRNIDREIALEKKIKQLDNIIFKRDQSTQTVYMLTKPQFFYDHTTKQALGFQNPFYLKKAQQLEPNLYDGNVIKNTSTIVIPDSEETLMLVEESRLKMLLKQHDPMMLEKKVNTTPVDYAALNQLSQDLETRFVPQTELSAEQAFWSQNSLNSSDPNPSCRPTKVEVPKELPKVSMVNTSLKKLKHHLAGFDLVIKERTMATAITEGSWGDNSVSNQSALSFDQYFELNELKAQSQEKDTVIKKLKERIKSLNRNMNEDKVKKNIEEIETINIELDHRVSHLIAENDALVNQIQELLVYVSDTCPSSPLKSEKLVVVTPMNKARKVTFAKTRTTSDNNTQIQVEFHQT